MDMVTMPARDLLKESAREIRDLPWEVTMPGDRVIHIVVREGRTTHTIAWLPYGFPLKVAEAFVEARNEMLKNDRR